MAKKDKKITEPEAIVESQPVEELTNVAPVIDVPRGSVAIRLKSGKGGLVVIKESDFERYEKDFELA